MATVSGVRAMSSEPIIQQLPTGPARPESHTRHSALLRIVRQLTDESDPDTVMRCLVDEAIALLRGEVGSAACWSEEEQVLKRVWSTIPLVDGRPYDTARAKASGGRRSCCDAR